MPKKEGATLYRDSDGNPARLSDTWIAGNSNNYKGILAIEHDRAPA